MEKSKTQEAILNQTTVLRDGTRTPNVSYFIRFRNLSKDKGPGAVMMTILKNHGLRRDQLIELLHQKFNTTGQYTEMFKSLKKAGVIDYPSRCVGYILTDLGIDVLKENGLI